MGYVATTGLNLPPDDARYEAGDPVPDDLVEPWMLDDGVVIEGAPAKAVPKTKAVK